jgi:release factor glutamine methyltransferase
MDSRKNLKKKNPAEKNIEAVLVNSSLPYLETEILIDKVLHQKKEWLYSNLNFRIPSEKYKKIKSLIKKRSLGEPIAYLVNCKEFYGLEFYVDRNVLIPRPETELIVDLVLDKIKKIREKDKRKILILDIGSGSGCIITAVAKNIKNEKKINYFASDKSAKALKIAIQNFKKNNPGEKIKTFQADLLPSQMKKNLAEFNFLIITANLPYLSTKQYATTKPDIKYEPKSALIAQDMGMKLIKKLLNQIDRLDMAKPSQSVIPAKAGIPVRSRENSTKINPSKIGWDSRLRGNDNSLLKISTHGKTSSKQAINLENKITCFAFLEINPGQKKPLEKHLQEENNFSKFKFFKDLNKKYRVLEIKKTSNKN